MKFTQVYEVIVYFTEDGLPRKRRFGSTESMKSVKDKAFGWVIEQGFQMAGQSFERTDTSEIWNLGEVNQ